MTRCAHMAFVKLSSASHWLSVGSRPVRGSLGEAVSCFVRRCLAQRHLMRWERRCLVFAAVKIKLSKVLSDVFGQ